MAQRIVVRLEDDLDGTEATETVHFGLDGVAYEIDLSDENAAQFRAQLTPWIGAARRVAGRKRLTLASSRRDLNAVRAWARENGHSVSGRGPVPDPVLCAYDAAHVS